MNVMTADVTNTWIQRAKVHGITIARRHRVHVRAIGHHRAWLRAAYHRHDAVAADTGAHLKPALPQLLCDTRRCAHFGAGDFRMAVQVASECDQLRLHGGKSLRDCGQDGVLCRQG
jgi:hypothetical protein